MLNISLKCYDVSRAQIINDDKLTTPLPLTLTNAELALAQWELMQNIMIAFH